MKFLEFFNKVFQIICFLFFLNYKLIECTLAPEDSNDSLNILPVIKYYPKVFLNISENLPISNMEFQQSVKEMIKYTITCENYLKRELENRMIESLIHAENFFEFITAVEMTNIWYKNFLSHLINGDYPYNIANEDGSSIDSSLIISLWLDNIENSIIKNISTTKEMFEDGCDKKISAHQHIYNIYNCMTLTILNGYAQLTDAYRNRINQESKNITIFKERRIKFKKSLTLIEERGKNALKMASQSIRRCDPLVYVENVNFIQLKYFIRGYVIGIGYLKHPTKTSLSEFSHSYYFGQCDNYQKNITSPNKFRDTIFQCNGMIHGCWKFDLKQICFPKNSNSIRQYQAFTTKDNKVYGPWEENICAKNNTDKYDIQHNGAECSYVHRWSTGYVSRTCDICACYCDDKFNPNTVRKFSLQQVQAKHSQGVVTGIKFDIDQDTIILKIRVGILANGTVDANQQSWDSNYVAKFNPGGLPPNLVNGTPAVLSDIFGRHPYETIKLDFNWRNVYLDNLVAPPGKVIQGVKFVACDEGISISILATSLNEGGAILPETAEWYSGCDRQLFPNERVEVRAPINANVPTKGQGTNKIISKPHTYVAFQVSGWSIDASQTVIPFIDAQQVITDPPVPLSAIGIYYKAQDSYGGFIGFELQTLDYSHFMNEDFISKLPISNET